MGMRGLKALVGVMSVLIVVGVTVIAVTLINRMSSALNRPGAAVAQAVVMDEPAGTAIVGIAAVGDRLAVQLRGGGADRVVFVDPHGGAVVGRISLPK
jgi:Family of unknown function (DUF6476)